MKAKFQDWFTKKKKPMNSNIKEKSHYKVRRGPRYAWLPITATVLCLCFCGSFQLGFQDIYYEQYVRILQNTTAEDGGSYNPWYFYQDDHSTFSVHVDPTIITFHCGAAIGAVFFSILFLRLGAKFSFLIFAGCAQLTGILIALGDYLSPFYTLCVTRSIFGISIGFLTCAQVAVLNELALDEDKNTFHFLTILAAPIGGIFGLFMTTSPIISQTLWYLGHFISLVPILVSFSYIAIAFRDPPSVLIFKGHDEAALLSAQHYYGENNADFALSEAHDRVKAKMVMPPATSIFSDKVALRTFILTIVVNAVAGFSGDRFSWVFLFRFVTSIHFSNSTLLSIIFFVLFIFVNGTIFCLLLLNRYERKFLLIGSAILVALVEISFGSFWEMMNHSGMKDEVKLTVVSILKALQQLFLSGGLNSVAYFVAVDLSFSDSKAVLLSLSFAIRALVTAFHPYVVGLLSDYSPLGSAFLTAIPMIAFAVFAGLRFPRLHALTPYQILQKFGYIMTINATPDEIQNVRKNMHKLWQSSKQP